MTVKEASCSGPAAPTTRHTYSPESAGVRLGSRSREPWVCRRRGGGSHQDKALGQASPQAGLCWCPGVLAGSRELRAPADADGQASFTEPYPSNPTTSQTRKPAQETVWLQSQGKNRVL